MLKKYDFNKIPITEILNDILVDSAKRGASDIHMDPRTNGMQIRIRIDGALVDYAEVPSVMQKNLVTRVKILAGMNITETRLPQDGAIKQTIQDMPLDLRVSALPTKEGEKVVIRILDYSMSIAGLETLGLSPDNLKKVLRMIAVPNGIILVTGATGSGKSTTVYSILNRLNREDVNFADRECVVFGKGDKERVVYFDARTKIHLQNYLNERSDTNPALFVSLRMPHRRLTIGGVEVRLRKLGQELGLHKVHPHKFRRTLATMAIDKGMPIEQLQRLLGHSKIDTTLQYAMVKQSNVKLAHKKYIG